MTLEQEVMTQRLRGLRLVLTALVLCLGWVPADAWAEDFATISDIATPDTRGRWRDVDETPSAAKLTDEARVPLHVGMVLAIGDRLQTDEARVTIRLGKGEHITMSPGTTLVLEERSVLQQLGEAYYQVRDMFSVQYGTVQTAVEGTEFAITGEEAGVGVRVTEGVVRVSNAGESVRVKRGQQVMVAAASAPPPPTRLPLSAARNARSTAWTLGRPRLQVGFMAGGGLLGDEAGAQMQTFAAIRVLPFLNVVADASQGYSPNSHRTGSGVGLEWALGGLSIGGSGTATLERWRYPCGGRYAAVHLGGSVHGRYTMDITRRFFVAAQAQAGGNADGIEATFGIGGGVSL